MTSNRLLARSIAPWLLPLALVACRGEARPKLALHDTEGRALEAMCDPKTGCVAKQIGGPRDPSARSAVVVHRQGLLTVACSAAPGAKEREDVRDCRPLECGSDRECPPEPGGPRYGHCINGLCVDPAGSLDSDDAVVLCLAGKGLGRESPAQVEAYSMGLNCGQPCQAPKPCRQP